MNLADYLSELLGQHDEVSLPGLGYFVRSRVSAYYNDNESRFYPPYHQVKFIPQLKDDDVFTQYIAEKKNISLASSKYFTEKFINKLKEDASLGKYLFADLGSFYTEQDQLVFKPNSKIPADPAFYGYPPVSIPRLGQPLSPGTAKPVFNETIIQPRIVTQQSAQTLEQPQYFEEDETEQRRRVNIWLILVIGLAAIALVVFGVYKFFPSTFNEVSSAWHRLAGTEKIITPKPVKQKIIIDTEKKVIPVADTVAKTTTPAVTPVANTTNQSRFVIIVSEYNHKHPAKADAAVKHLQSIGLDSAKILTDFPGSGPLIKVSVGSFASFAAADSAERVMIKAKKITKYRVPTEIKPN